MLSIAAINPAATPAIKLPVSELDLVFPQSRFFKFSRPSYRRLFVSQQTSRPALRDRF